MEKTAQGQDRPEPLPETPSTAPRTWRVAETSSLPKPGRANEDVVVVTEHFAAIFDGTTAKHPVRLAGETPGAFAAHHAAAALSTLRPDAPLDEALEVLSGALRDAGAAHGFVGREVEPPSCTMVAVSYARDELWSVGGGYARVGHQTIALPDPPSDALIAAFRSLYQSLLVARGADVATLLETDPAHELVMPALALQWHFRNDAHSPWGYGAIDGSEIPQRFRLCRALGAAREVVMVSDGYLSAAPTLAQAEAELATAVAADPLLLTGPATRMRPAADSYAFDDRSYVRLVR